MEHNQPEHPAYRELKDEALRDWNTWNNTSVLSCVHLPEGFAITLVVELEEPHAAIAAARTRYRARREEFGADSDFKSEDRSQPPVGSLAVREVYRRHREPWLLELVIDDLLTWNLWWHENRRVGPLRVEVSGVFQDERSGGDPWLGTRVWSRQLADELLSSSDRRPDPGASAADDRRALLQRRRVLVEAGYVEGPEAPL